MSFKEFELIRIYKNSQGYNVVNYNPRSLKKFLKNEWEVR
jgi:hypothetical protein